MCGIAGILYFDGERAVEPRLLDRMTDTLTHRGPDGRGTHIDGPLGLGHRRLAIIDLSDDAAQPMCNEDGSVWVVVNGEIYNFAELRDELRAKGHTFKSGSDSEVLLHLYEEHGDELVERLRGMFAFALWDARRRRLVLARDRFGQKPLYYRLAPEGLWFGSEVKAIVADPAVPRRVDFDALHDYLTYRVVPAPRTGFEGISALPPAHVLTVEADGRSALRRYWSLRMTPKRTGSDEALLEEVAGTLDEAVRLRLVSDVPLGAFLSGGVDSSAIVASICAARDPRQVRTFAIGFDEPAWDETTHAQVVADHLGTDHTTLTLDAEAMSGIERIAWHHDTPFADSSCLPTFAVSALARRQVTVALSGDGGDELFLGYRRYQGTWLELWTRELPAPARALLRTRPLISLIARMNLKDRVGEQLGHNRYCTHLGPSDLYATRMEVFSPELKARLYTDQARADARGRDARQRLCHLISRSDGVTLIERCAHADAQSYLSDDILRKVDVASMAVGLEARAPLLDHVLAEQVAALPVHLKLDRWSTKVGLKRIVAPRIPRSIIERGKMGFGVPLFRWFRRDLDDVWHDTILSPRARARGWFQPRAVEALIEEHSSGRTNHQARLFTLMMLEEWCRQWIDPAQAPLSAPGSPAPSRPRATASS